VSLPKATTGLEIISYRAALLNNFLHVTVYVFTLFAQYTTTDLQKNGIITVFAISLQLMDPTNGHFYARRYHVTTV
jgi:hypothetical protein